MFIAIGIFFVFLLLGMPVAFSIGLSGFSFFMIRDLPMTVLVQKSISTSQSFTMLAIPLFILAGNLMNSCGITKRLMRFANACTGHMYGNIGQVSCLMSTLMGGVSGSAVADASMECRILGPEMTRLGYDRGWSAAINGLSGLIVATIPPSMGLIIYGTVGEVSAEYAPNSPGGDPADGRKVKGATIHWVDAATALDAEVRVYSELFSDPAPDGADKDFLACMNPDSLEVLTGCKVEPRMRDIAAAYDKTEKKGKTAPSFQFMRLGYFCLDNKDCSEDHLVFNRSVTLKDSFKK